MDPAVLPSRACTKISRLTSHARAWRITCFLMHPVAQSSLAAIHSKERSLLHPTGVTERLPSLYLPSHLRTKLRKPASKHFPSCRCSKMRIIYTCDHPPRPPFPKEITLIYAAVDTAHSPRFGLTKCAAPFICVARAPSSLGAGESSSFFITPSDSALHQLGPKRCPLPPSQQQVPCRLADVPRISRHE